MNPKGFDIKSLIIGLLVGCCLFMWLGERGTKKPLYQIACNGREVYLLESNTGHLWTIEYDNYIDQGTPQNPSCIIYESEELWAVDGKKMTSYEYEKYTESKQKLTNKQISEIFAEVEALRREDPNSH